MVKIRSITEIEHDDGEDHGTRGSGADALGATGDAEAQTAGHGTDQKSEDTGFYEAGDEVLKPRASKL